MRTAQRSSRNLPGQSARRQQGVALVIVLAFVVIITGVILAYFSRSIFNRQISNSSSGQTKAALFAQGAADTIIADLQQEIVTSSSATSVSGSTTIYTPLTPASMLPQMSGTAGLPAGSTWALNFLIRSASGQNFYSSAATIPGNAIAVSSTIPSLNNRSVSLARWNAAYLLPLDPSNSNPTPLTTGTVNGGSGFIPPDWVLVARNGSNPTSWNSNMTASATNSSTVIGRYAYVVYHEGGLLDANVAGYPSTSSTVTQVAYKPAESYADLTQLPGGLTQAQVDQLIAWRNYASAQAPNPYNNAFPFSGAPSSSGSNYYNSVVSNPSGFLRISGTALNNNGTMSATTGQSDRLFASRQELIRFFQKGLALDPLLSGTSLDVLNYLATFTRDINQPSFAPGATRPLIATIANGGNNGNGGDAQINPPFLSSTGTRVTTAFTRNDGSQAVVGDPLVKRRFALSRLAWLTYLGVSASRNNPPSSSPTGADYDMWLLEYNYNIPQTLVTQGNAANVYRYFGLSWVSDTRTDINGNNMDPGLSYKWVYSHQQANPALSATGTPVTSLSAVTGAPIMTLSQVAAAGREPDFVELLKAAICAGSIGKAITAIASPATGSTSDYQARQDTSLDYAIIQLAANIIAQSQPAAYAPRILFDGTPSDTGSAMEEFRGVEDFPYLYRVRGMHYQVRDGTPSVSYTPVNSPDLSGTVGYSSPGDPFPNTEKALTDSGLGVQFEAPELWNPHSFNPAATAAGPRPTQFRIVAIDGPPSIFAPSTSSDPNALAMMGYTRDGALGYLRSTLTPAVTVVPTNMLHSLSYTQNSTALYFTIPFNPTALSNPAQTRLDLFREPTFLFRPGLPSGSNLHFGGDGDGNPKNQVFNSNSETASPPGEVSIQPYLQTNVYGYKGIKTSGTGVHFDWPSGGTASNLNDDQIYLGIYMGSFPMRWLSTVSGTYWDIAPNTTDVSGGGSAGASLTYRLQYQDPTNSSNWITYDEKYAGFMGAPGRGLNTGNFKSPRYLTWKMLGNNSDGQNYSWMDPRSCRFGGLFNNYQYNVAGDEMTNWSSTSSGASQVAGAAQAAMRGMHIDESAGTADYLRGFQSPIPGWYPIYSSAATFYPGLACQNNPENGYDVSYFSDPDGVVRRGISAYVQPTVTGTAPAVTPPSGSPSGLPTTVAMDLSTASATTAASQIGAEEPSRPIILNRPFVSVADLGYVFSGTPWRNLDMMTPESGGAALMDVFCINDTSDPGALTAGKVNLNTRQAPVLQAILANAYKDQFILTGTTLLPSTGSAAAATATTIAGGLVARTSGTAALGNLSELVGKWSGTAVYSSDGASIDGGQSYSGFSGTNAPALPTAPASSPPNLSSILYGDTTTPGYYSFANVERFREAAVRALANTGQTRVWNLMIDLIAQTGRFPAGASGAAAFMVEGEQRYWIHVAIDRYTGQVLDKQIEMVKE